MLASKGDDVRSFEHGLLPFVMIIGRQPLIMLQRTWEQRCLLLITVTMFSGWRFVRANGSTGRYRTDCMAVLATAAGYRIDR